MVLQPIPDRRPAIGRRRFLVAAGGLALLTACGRSDRDDSATQGEGAGGGSFDDLLLLQPGFADGLRVASTLAAGTTIRAPFFLFSSDGGPAVNGLPDGLAGTLEGPDGGMVDVELVRHDAGIPTPYFLLAQEVTAAGLYRLHTSIDGEDQDAEFVVAEREEVSLVQVGDHLRPVATPTLDDSRGYDPICTRADPCPFHRVNLADVIDNGRPTALLIATPGYCQTSICGPSVELLIELGITADLDVIHSEVYLEPGQINDSGTFGEVGPVITTYGMTFEPSFIVADSTGTVVARLDFSFDRTEMATALALVS